MERLTNWFARWGNAGAVANARRAIDESAMDSRSIDALVARLPAITEVPAAAA